MENKNMNYEEMNRRRALAFYEEKLKVHITKIDGTFYNGQILKVNKDYFVIEDREDGPKIVFFFELKNPIEKYQEVGR